MKIILAIIMAIWIWAFITPGRQLRQPPIWASKEERQNWKPTSIYWIFGLLLLIFLFSTNYKWTH